MLKLKDIRKGCKIRGPTSGETIDCSQCVWLHCSNMLQDVIWCWIKFENGQIFFATFLVVAKCCIHFASSFIKSHNMIQRCCKMLCKFGQALSDMMFRGYFKV